MNEATRANFKREIERRKLTCPVCDSPRFTFAEEELQFGPTMVITGLCDLCGYIVMFNLNHYIEEKRF